MIDGVFFRWLTLVIVRTSKSSNVWQPAKSIGAALSSIKMRRIHCLSSRWEAQSSYLSFRKNLCLRSEVTQKPDWKSVSSLPSSLSPAPLPWICMRDARNAINQGIPSRFPLDIPSRVDSPLVNVSIPMATQKKRSPLHRSLHSPRNNRLGLDYCFPIIQFHPKSS